MARNTNSTLKRCLLAAACLLPLFALAQSALETRIAEIGEQSLFVPDQALLQLLQIDSEARAAPWPTRAKFLAQLSLARMRMGQDGAAMLLADELIGFARTRKDDVALATGLATKAFVLFALADRRASHALAFEADQLAHGTTDLNLQIMTGIAAGQACAEEGDYPAALTRLQLALDLARRLNAPAALASALNALALLYDQMKQYDKGFEALHEALARGLQTPGRLALAKHTEYFLAIDSLQPRRARLALQKELALERKLGASGMIATTLVNLSDSYLKENDYVRALRFANQAIEMARLVNSSATEATGRVNIGSALLGMGRVAEGKRSFQAGLAYYEKTGDKPSLQSVYVEYGAALERAGDFSGALLAYHRERELSDELFEKQRQRSVYDIQEKYETEKKQRQIELLSRENEVKSAELGNRRLQQRIWWLLAVVFALAAVIVGLLYRKLRQVNAHLNVKNHELAQQNARDPLTGLYNRRHFQEFMRAPGAAGGDELAGALFLLDVDHFKHVNDSFGHAAGDAVLKMIADTLREVLRETDMIVRWGGEEFLAYLPTLPRQRIDEIARRILLGISTQGVSYHEHQIVVNVSVGFAPFPLTPAGLPLPWERVVNLADMALYLAKEHGRNRAYGVHGFHNFGATSMEAIEHDLEAAWRAGFVELSVVTGSEPLPVSAVA